MPPSSKPAQFPKTTRARITGANLSRGSPERESRSSPARAVVCLNRPAHICRTVDSWSRVPPFGDSSRSKYGQSTVGRMQCLNCGGQLEWAGGGQHARCMRCLSMFSQQNGQLTPIVVQAPGGGFNPEFNNIFAGNLGFGPPPPGSQPMPPPGQGGGMQQPQQPDYAGGRFDLGGGQQLRVKINGHDARELHEEQGLRNDLGLDHRPHHPRGDGVHRHRLRHLHLLRREEQHGRRVRHRWPNRDSVAAKWDGKTPFSCGGNDTVALTGVTATAGITVGGNCKVTLVNVNITAPVGIAVGGNGGVTMSGGSITSTTENAVSAGGQREGHLRGHEGVRQDCQDRQRHRPRHLSPRRDDRAMADLPLRCACGKLHGTARNAAPETTTHTSLATAATARSLRALPRTKRSDERVEPLRLSPKNETRRRREFNAMGAKENFSNWLNASVQAICGLILTLTPAAAWARH